ncbi:MAG: hypothetical protein JNL98_00880 [Bryobacterales bacterium]|nr:hypothetical protein [Bryobacterales bacterium]
MVFETASGDKDRLAQNDRVSDQCFEPDEELYRRVMHMHVIEGILSPLAFESKPQSVNRAKYSRPMDVVHPACCDGHDRSDWLVAVLLVEDVRRSYRLEDGRVFVLFPKHTPKPSCYPHSEVWCNRQDEPSDAYQEPPKSIRRQIRLDLAQAARLLPNATDGTQGI